MGFAKAGARPPAPAHGPATPRDPVAQTPTCPAAWSARSWFSIYIGVKDGRIHLIQFTIFVISISPNLCICLFTEPDTTHKRGRSFFIFKRQFERENITNNANPFLYCAEICPSVYVQSIYRNSIPKGKSILKRSFPATRSIKIETGIQPSENWVMSTFSGQKPFTTIIWTIPPYFLTFFKAWLWI